MKMLKAIVTAVALGLMLTAPANADVNLIINGSFKTPDVKPGELGPVGGWEVYYVPTPGLEWIPVTANGMEIQDHVVGEIGHVWEAYQGDQFAEMDTYGNGNLSLGRTATRWTACGNP